MTVPIIDLAPLRRGDDEGTRLEAARLARACRQTGFYYVKNHGISERLSADLFDLASRFFDLDLEEKSRIHQSRSEVWPPTRGYLPLEGENLDPEQGLDLKEVLVFGNDLPEGKECGPEMAFLGPDQWPQQPEGLRPLVGEYHEEMIRLGRALMPMFAIGLGLRPDHFQSYFSHPMTLLRLHRYPPQAGSENDQIGAGAHYDTGCIIMVNQDEVGGLEILDRSGSWIPAPFEKGTFVCNIGRLMTRWTNDLYRSNVHRVVNRSTHRRASICFFMDPDPWQEIAPLPECITPQHPARYLPVNSGRHKLDQYVTEYPHLRHLRIDL